MDNLKWDFKGVGHLPKWNTFPNKHWHVYNVELQKKKAIERGLCLLLGPISKEAYRGGQWVCVCFGIQHHGKGRGGGRVLVNEKLVMSGKIFPIIQAETHACICTHR